MPKGYPSKVERTCLVCGKSFLTIPAAVQRGGGKYCSRACYHKSQAIPLETHFRKGVGQTTENGCVLWAGIKDAKGRGIIYSSTHRRGKRVFSAHRVAWELAKGAIPEGQCVPHTCDNPPCINVEHLFLGTQLENIADMVIKDRSPNRKLTPAEVRSIRRRYAEGGVSQQQLADEYGVNQTTVSMIILRKRYRLVN